MDLRRKKLSERGANRLLPGVGARKIHVGIDGEPNPGHDVLQRSHLGSGDPDGLPELDPGFDPAGVLAVPVVIEDALDPFASDAAVRAVRQHRGILDRDADLIIKTVRHPAADLTRR